MMHFEDHHVLWKMLGGSDNAANYLSVRAYLHRGKGFGLHQHILKHMDTTYEQLGKRYDDIIRNDGIGMDELYDDLYGGYKTYFDGVEAEGDIMEYIDTALREGMGLD